MSIGADLESDAYGEAGGIFSRDDGKEIANEDVKGMVLRQRCSVELPKEWHSDRGKLAFTVDNILTRGECAMMIERANVVGWKPSPMAPLQSGLRCRYDNAELSQTILERLQPYLPEVHARRRLVGLTPTFRFVRYAAGCEVLPHPDTAGGDAHTPVAEPCSSHLTVLLYLNDDYSGCETHFLPSPGIGAAEPWPLICERQGVKVEPRLGRALVFEHSLLHGCPPLQSGGNKFVCRLDVAYEDVDYVTGEKLVNPYRDSTLARAKTATASRAFAKARAALRRRGSSLADKIRAQRDADARGSNASRAFVIAGTTSRFRGYGAIVTGGSAGIGFELCRVLVDELGMTVVVVSRSPPPRDDLLFVDCDLADVQPDHAVDRAIALLDQATVPPLILVNNAAFSTQRASVLDGDPNDCDRLFRCNALAPLHLTRRFIQVLTSRSASRGSVVNVSSLSAYRIQNPSLGVYAATKAALAAITETTRLELAQRRLPYRVSLVSPGITQTNFYASCLNSQAKSDLLFAATNALKAQDVVDAILFALIAPDDVQVHDIQIRANHCP